MGSMPGEGMAPEFVFFTVDPFRDTPEELGKYVGYFNSGFTGVTGKPETISRLVADLGLYYAYTDPDDDQVLDDVLHRPAMEYYGVIHSSRLLFISPQAELVAVMSPPFRFDNVMEFLNALRKHHGD
jgi:protein SCO1/2